MNNVLGYNILRAMDSHNVTMVELARRTRLDRSNLYKRICDPETMKVSMLIKIANAIGVDYKQLLEDVE